MTTETQAPDPGSVRATGLPADAEPMRSRPERFKPNDGGTWIDDDDFGFDAMLKVDGDFGSDADRLAYAQSICDKLNAPAIPAPHRGASMADDPIMLAAPGRLRDIELAAMRAYRAKYPDGPPWLDLAITTRGSWIDHVDAGDSIPAGRTQETT